jgi:hypothetical protein
LRTLTVRMSFEERAPFFDRLQPLGISIVQILVDIRCGNRVDGGHAHVWLCGRKRLVDDDIYVIKPSELCNVFMAQLRIYIDYRDDYRDRQRQNERVFPTKAHAARSSRKCRVPLRPYSIQLGCVLDGCVDWWTRRLKWACSEIVIVKSAVKPDPELSRHL